MSNSFILPIDRTLSSAITTHLSGPRGNDKKGLTPTLQISYIEASSSDGSMVYPGHSLVKGLTPLQRSSRCILQPSCYPTRHFKPGVNNYKHKHAKKKSVDISYVMHLIIVNYKLIVNYKWVKSEHVLFKT